MKDYIRTKVLITAVDLKEKLTRRTILMEVILPMVLLLMSLYLLSVIMGVSRDYEMLFAGQCLVSVLMLLSCRKIKASYTITVSVIALLSIGLFIQCLLAHENTGYPESATTFFSHILCGTVMYIFLIWLFSRERKITFFFFTNKGCLLLSMVSFLCYTACLISGRIHNAANWIVVGNFSIQGTEICKLLYLWILAVLSERMNFEKYGKKIMLLYMLNAVFLLAASELGYLIVITIVTVVIIVIRTEDLKELLNTIKRPVFVILIALAVGSLMAVAIYFLDGNGFVIDILEKVKGRVLGFLFPEQYPDTYGYQNKKLNMAIFSGGLFGNNKEVLLPVAQSDLVFGVIIAKLGLFFALAVMTLYTLFIFIGSKAAANKNSCFGMTFVVGIFIQTFYNLASVIGCVPIAGVPVYFISAGGTAMVCGMAIAAIIVSTTGGNFQYKKGARNEEKNDVCNSMYARPDGILSSNSNREERGHFRALFRSRFPESNSRRC